MLELKKPREAQLVLHVKLVTKKEQVERELVFLACLNDNLNEHHPSLGDIFLGRFWG